MPPVESKKKKQQEKPDTLGSVKKQLDKTPYDYSLYQKRVDLAKKSGNNDEYEAAMKAWSQKFPLQEDIWLEWLSSREEALSNIQGMDLITPTQELSELYMQSLRDYISVPLSVAFLKFAISQYCSARGYPYPKSQQETLQDLSDNPQEESDPVKQELWSLDMTRTCIFSAIESSAQHLTEGHKVWNLWRDFEIDVLKRDTNTEQAARVQQMYLARLSQPHSEIDDTLQGYSNFISTFANDTYEESMVKANKVKAPALEQWNERQGQERKLASNSYTLQAYQAYLRWEQQVKEPNIELVTNLFERAIAHCYFHEEIWKDYQAFLRKYTQPKSMKEDKVENADEGDNEDEMNDEAEQSYYSKRIIVAIRATRNLPSSAEMWATYMGLIEQMGKINEVESIFQTALSTKLFTKNPSGLAVLYIAKADFHRRLTILDLEPEQAVEYGVEVPDVGSVLNEGINLVSKNKEGDPSLRLERYLAKYMEYNARQDQAVATWEKAVKKYKSSASAWSCLAEAQLRLSPAEARETYKTAASMRLDYPLEYLYPSWIEFEHQFGDYEDIELATQEFNRKSQMIMASRARSNYWNQQQQQQQPQGQAQDQEQYQSNTQMEIDVPQGEEQKLDQNEPQASMSTAPQQQGQSQGQKRELEVNEGKGHDQTTSNKKVKTHADSNDQLKRDREHCTVLISASEKDITEQDINRLFRDCGKIRETKIYPRDNDFVASVEFFDRESVLPALTKDKKKLNNVDVAVHQTWKATLYVTNFPEDLDDAGLRDRFSKYGEILETRWPSKRFKNSRRFCYVQYVTPESSEAALELNGKPWDDSSATPVSVAISDPERKKARSDADMDKRELKVDGIARSVNDKDLSGLFEKYGEITRIHLEKDEKTGKAKGWAFVEFKDESSAQKALALNNYELKNRRIAVTAVDRRSRRMAQQNFGKHASSRSEIRERSIRIRGFPQTQEVQEPLVQQIFEKFGSVNAVNLIKQESSPTEAIVEFAELNDAGKVLLLPQGELKYSDEPLEVIAESSLPPPNKPAQGNYKSDKYKKSNSSQPFVPRSFGGPRGRPGLGSGRGRGGRGGFFASSRQQQSQSQQESSSTTNMEVDSNNNNDQENNTTQSSSGKTADDFRKMLSGTK